MALGKAQQAAVAACLSASVVACGGRNDGAAATAPTPACAPAVVRTGTPPTWAKGLPGVPADTPFVVARDGHVAAFLFVSPMKAKLPPGGANKVLLVVRPSTTGDAPMRISARFGAHGQVRIFRGVAGDEQDGLYRTRLTLPRPGCWRLSLTWPKGADRVDVHVV